MVSKITAMTERDHCGGLAGLATDMKHQGSQARKHWDFLRPRIKLLVALQGQWGNIRDMYGSQRGSMFLENPIPTGIRDPGALRALPSPPFQLQHAINGIMPKKIIA